MVAGDARRGFTLTTHQDWLRRCHAKGTRPEFCDSEDTLERWEQIVADIKWRAIQEWKLATTVQMFFTDGYVEPETSVSLVLAPNPANLKIMKFHFGNETSTITPQTGVKRATEVKSLADLDANGMWILFRYNTKSGIASVVCVILAIWAAFPLLASPRSMSVDKLLNVALKNDGYKSDELWEAVYEKIHYMLLNEYRAQCAAFEKHPTMPVEEIFSHLKNLLRIDYGLRPFEFGSLAEVDSATRKHIRDLVLMS